MKEQQSITFVYEGGELILRIFEEDSTTTEYRLRKTQVPIILHDLSKVIWDHFIVVPR